MRFLLPPVRFVVMVVIIVFFFGFIAAVIMSIIGVMLRCETSSPSGIRRAATTTFAPAFAKASTVARPMPELPPVTRATLDSNVVPIY